MTEEIEMLYRNWVGEPKPQFWPDYLEDDPVKAHGLYSFYRGLCLGLHLATAAFFPYSEL